MSSLNSTTTGGNTTDDSITYVWDTTSEPSTWTDTVSYPSSIKSSLQVKHRLAYIIATCKQDEEPCVLALYPEGHCFLLLIHPLFSNSNSTWLFNTPELAYHFVEEQTKLGKFTELKCLIGPEELKNRMVLDKARPQKEE